MLLLLPVGEVAVALLLLAPLLSPNGAGVGAGAGVGVGAAAGVGAGAAAGVGAGAAAVALVGGGATVEALAAALPLLDVAPAT